MGLDNAVSTSTRKDKKKCPFYIYMGSAWTQSIAQPWKYRNVLFFFSTYRNVLLACQEAVWEPLTWRLATISIHQQGQKSSACTHSKTHGHRSNNRPCFICHACVVFIPPIRDGDNWQERIGAGDLGGEKAGIASRAIVSTWLPLPLLYVARGVERRRVAIAREEEAACWPPSPRRPSTRPRTAAKHHVTTYHFRDGRKRQRLCTFLSRTRSSRFPTYDLVRGATFPSILLLRAEINWCRWSIRENNHRRVITS